MRLAVLATIGSITLIAFGVPPAQARYPLPATLPQEQDIILACTVSDTLMAKDCGLPPTTVADKRASAFLQVEAQAPDYLIGATPGAKVSIMVRRSTAAPLDGDNPGRALAPPTAGLSPVIDPDWAKMPTPSDIAGYFPDRAMRFATSGEAEVRCSVGVHGDLLGCWVASENPSDMGFGLATLNLSIRIQMKATARDGSPTAGRTYALHAMFDVGPREAKIMLSTAP